MKSDMYSTFSFHLIMWPSHTFSYVIMSEEPVHGIKNELKLQIHKKCWQYPSMPFYSRRDCWRLACFLRFNVDQAYGLRVISIGFFDVNCTPFNDLQIIWRLKIEGGNNTNGMGSNINPTAKIVHYIVRQ